MDGSTSVGPLRKQSFNQYKISLEEHGFKQSEQDMFGDRSPKGYDKLRLLSKVNDTVFWLFEKR